MIYIDDVSSRSDENRTALMYSIYDGASWSAAQPILMMAPWTMHRLCALTEMVVYILCGRTQNGIWHRCHAR